MRIPAFCSVLLALLPCAIISADTGGISASELAAVADAVLAVRPVGEAHVWIPAEEQRDDYYDWATQRALVTEVEIVVAYSGGFAVGDRLLLLCSDFWENPQPLNGELALVYCQQPPPTILAAWRELLFRDGRDRAMPVVGVAHPAGLVVLESWWGFEAATADAGYPSKAAQAQAYDAMTNETRYSPPCRAAQEAGYELPAINGLLERIDLWFALNGRAFVLVTLVIIVLLSALSIWRAMRRRRCTPQLAIPAA